MKKRLFAAFLASALLFAVLPLSVSAYTLDTGILKVETINGEQVTVLGPVDTGKNAFGSYTMPSNVASILKDWSEGKYKNWAMLFPTSSTGSFSVFILPDNPSITFPFSTYGRQISFNKCVLSADFYSASGSAPYVFNGSPTLSGQVQRMILHNTAGLLGAVLLSENLRQTVTFPNLGVDFVVNLPTEKFLLRDNAGNMTYSNSAPEHSVTVKYQYPDGTEAAPDYVHNVPEGEAYSVSSPAVPGYTPDKAEVSGTMGKEDVLVTVTYTKDPVFHTLTVHYRYEDGTQAAPSHSEQVEEGKPYSVNSPVMDGYTVEPGVIFGTMGGSALTFQVVYTPIPPPPVSSEESSSSGGGESSDSGGSSSGGGESSDSGGSSSGGGESSDSGGGTIVIPTPDGGTTTLPTPEGGTVTIPIPDTDNPLIVFSGQSIANSALTLSKNISSAATFAVCALLVITGFVLVFRLVKRLFW